MPASLTQPPLPPAPQTVLQLLPLHLQMSMASYLCLQNALQSANAASTSWSASLPNWKSGPDLSTLPEALRCAILREALKRQQETIEGVRHYLHSERQPVTYPSPPQTLWQKHAATLYHFPAHIPDASNKNSATAKPDSLLPLLIIPSLINRYYILDLDEQRSLVRYLAAQGHDVYLLDWGKPAQAEYHFGIGDYVNEILAPAAEFIRERESRGIGILGYCMGGLLSLVMSQFHPRGIERLVLLATPWNFHSSDIGHARLTSERTETLEKLLESAPFLPGETILYLFYLSDPWRFQEKFREFTHLKSKAAKSYFSAVEHWANDCVPLPRKVARECFIDCQQKNLGYLGKWEMNGQLVNPASITIPAFIVAPQYDRIVPPGSSVALAENWPHARVYQPSSGHISMITGDRRKTELWKPLTRWLQRKA